MDMAERQIVVTFAQVLEGNVVYAAYAFIVSATVTAGDGKVSHQHHRKPFGVLLFGLVQQGLEEARLAFLSGSAGVQYREVLRINVRDGNYISFLFSFPVLDGDDMPRQIYVLTVTLNVPDDRYSEMLPQAAVYFQFRTAVMISGSDYDSHFGAGLVYVQQPFGVHLLRGGGGGGIVVDISAYCHDVGLFVPNDFRKLSQEVFLLLAPVIVV